MEISLNNISIFSQATDDNSKLVDILESLVEKYAYKRISVCSAYASSSGVKLIRGLFTNEVEFRWIIGLDDAFTEPAALIIANETYNSKLLVVERQRTHRHRFHPKVYLLDSNENDDATLIVGSANMTEPALTKNCEAYTVIQAQTDEDTDKFQEFWNSLWKIGEPLTEDLLADYKIRYKRRPPENPIEREKRTTKSDKNRIKRATQQSINNARLIWIELGSMTGYHWEQTDIVKNLAAFLGIPQEYDIDDEFYININSPNGIVEHTLMFKKGMWRFMNLQQAFQQVLKPNPLKTSPYILVVDRKNDEYKMRILNINSDEAKIIRDRSNETGFIGKSVNSIYGRYYGWF